MGCVWGDDDDDNGDFFYRNNIHHHTTRNNNGNTIVKNTIQSKITKPSFFRQNEINLTKRKRNPEATRCNQEIEKGKV